MKKNNTLAQIVAALKKGKCFFIAGHQNPDGDSLGSTLALTSLLRRIGKEVYPFSKDRPGDDLFFLPDLNKVNFGVLPTEHNYDTLIMLECSEPTRGGNLDICFKNASQIINIDRHITGQFYGDFNYIDALASSTAEIMVRLFKEMNARPTANEATCLYTGLVTD
ncbi:MAG: DHH family phosphoesterase, partial [Elusimicrobiaceae bacterium]|nr:DHH family phosphoesterase [Elusimicrobiaceae bacterium]